MVVYILSEDGTKDNISFKSACTNKLTLISKLKKEIKELGNILIDFSIEFISDNIIKYQYVDSSNFIEDGTYHYFTLYVEDY